MPVRKPPVPLHAYFEAEAAAVDRHEYHDGEVLMMAGGTYIHSVIITNTLVAVQTRLKGKPCRASEANTRVSPRPGLSYVYPDLTVVCGPPQFDPADNRQTTVLNPADVVEVVSPSTEAYDRGGKFTIYRDCPTLRQ